MVLNALGKEGEEEIIDKYICADELEADVCFLKIKEITDVKTTTTVYTKKCSGNKYCNEKGMCIKRDLFLLDNGEDCVISEECKSKFCSNKKCSIQTEGGECSVKTEESSLST